MSSMNCYERTIRIESHDTNCENELGLVGMLIGIQNVISEHTAALKVDFANIIKESNAFWVILKMKVKMFKQPKFGSTITIKTYPLLPSMVRCERECVITDEQGDIVAASTGEWCILDYETGRPRKVSSIAYPFDMEHIAQRALEERPERIIFAPTPGDLSYERVIRLTDLDVNYHTNNVSYTRFGLDAFPSGVFREKAVAEYDINFDNQSYEGETLKIYKKESAPDVFLICGEEAATGRRVFTSKMVLGKRGAL